MSKPRLIAFYLPQFHPIPENDKWWGPGFTEWTNVAKAKPLYPGHEQPRLPADLGFYDLRVPEVRERQAQLAREAGVTGFCYWHYWFGNGRRILERPFQEVLDLRSPDFPFCLAWANESWTGIWHGQVNNKLIDQTYPGPADEIAHFNWALKAFKDPRYLRVDGKPIFVIYKPHDMPSTTGFILHWRQLAEQHGLPGIFFVAISCVYKPGVDMYHNPILAPFDAITQLTPQDFLLTHGHRTWKGLPKRVWQRDFGAQLPKMARRFGRPRRIDYSRIVDAALEGMPPGPRYLPCVLPNWDNTPRSRHRGVVYENSTPELFRRYLLKAFDKVASHPPEQSIIFLKAWNEWAEGNIVEPDAKWGHQYLDVLRQLSYSDQNDNQNKAS